MSHLLLCCSRFFLVLFSRLNNSKLVSRCCCFVNVHDTGPSYHKSFSDFTDNLDFCNLRNETGELGEFPDLDAFVATDGWT